MIFALASARQNRIDVQTIHLQIIIYKNMSQHPTKKVDPRGILGLIACIAMLAAFGFGISALNSNIREFLYFLWARLCAALLLLLVLYCLFGSWVDRLWDFLKKRFRR